MIKRRPAVTLAADVVAIRVWWARTKCESYGAVTVFWT